MKKGIVYFISDNNGCIKVGVTENMKSRMRTLQNASANELEIIYTVTTRNKKEAFELEAALHRELKDYRVKNEWFEEHAVMKLINRRTVRVEGFKFSGMKKFGWFGLGWLFGKVEV